MLLLPALVTALYAGRALAQRPLGIDVSDYQGSINWTSVKGAGISFAWTKATEGVGAYQATFTNNEVNASAASVPIGAYHYARYDLNSGTSGATSEANYFWSVAGAYIRGGGSYLMPMLDVEASTNGYTAATLAQWINTWCNVLSNNAYAAGNTVRPVIYVSACHASHFGKRRTSRSRYFPGGLRNVASLFHPPSSTGPSCGWSNGYQSA